MAIAHVLECERPLHELERKVEALAALAENAEDHAALDAAREEYREALRDLYENLQPWDVVRVARHPRRPQGRDYIELICKDFCELHGDRRFGDDPAIVTGLARIGPHKVMVVAHNKGKETSEKIACHFGCAHPEGYRKALHKMRLAEKFGIPIVTFVDTPGAYPGLGAEQRGQAEAIAMNLREMARLKTPVVSVVIGEGGSGGALGIAVADRVAMMQFAWYSVISPEGCAAILWKEANPTTNADAARSLRLTAKDNLELGVIDTIIAEPIGGAHRDPAAAAANAQAWIVEQLTLLKRVKPEQLPVRRLARFRQLGQVLEVDEPTPEPADTEASAPGSPATPEAIGETGLPTTPDGRGDAGRKRPPADRDNGASR